MKSSWELMVVHRKNVGINLFDLARPAKKKHQRPSYFKRARQAGESDFFECNAKMNCAALKHALSCGEVRYP